MKQDFLRFHELSVRNKYQEQMTGLNMVFFEKESYLLCSLDHTGRSLAEIFNGDSRIVGGRIFDAAEQPEKSKAEPEGGSFADRGVVPALRAAVPTGTKSGVAAGD